MKPISAYFLIALLSGFFVFISFSYGLFAGSEYRLEDLLYVEKPISDDIIIVAIDNESIQRIGQWPWPRKVFAEALAKLAKNQPLAVGLDVIFSEPSRFGVEDDRALAAVLNNLPYPAVMPVEVENLILLENGELAGGGALKPLALFAGSPKVEFGQVNLFLDSDGVVRRFPLFVKTESGEEFPAFSYAVVKAAGKEILPEDNFRDVERIVYFGAPGRIKRLPFWHLLEENSLPELKNKILFIGSVAADLHDEKLTPISRGALMPGVEIQANIANMLISGYRLRPLGFSAMAVWIFFAAFVPALVFLAFRRALLALGANVFLGFFYTLAAALIFDNGVAVNLTHLNFAWAFSSFSLFGYQYFVGEKERRQLKKNFAKYVSKEVLAEIMKDPEKVSLGGEEREITILFSDIRSFTSWSEKTEPQKLIHSLNKYFSEMTEEILKNKGVVDKYIGDAIMAFWGAPLDDEEQADNALRAAQGMLERLKKLNKELLAAGEQEIKIGIGIHTGTAIVGNLGSESRFDYTAIGDAVNVASRLEGLSKTYNAEIIISESSKNKIKLGAELKFLDKAAVKGRENLVNIYTVV